MNLLSRAQTTFGRFSPAHCATFSTSTVAAMLLPQWHT